MSPVKAKRAVRLLTGMFETIAYRKDWDEADLVCCTIEGDDGRTFVMPVPLPRGFRVPAEIASKLPRWLKVTA
jgi:hypothetical protein